MAGCFLVAAVARIADAQVVARETAENHSRRTEFHQQLHRVSSSFADSTQRYDTTRQYKIAIGPLGAPMIHAATVPRWQPVGTAALSSNGTPLSGRVTSLAVSAADPKRLLAGSAAGGVWLSADGGGSWTALTNAACALAVGAVAFHPTVAGVMYAGTGEGNYSDSFEGCGLLESRDGGQTWLERGASTFRDRSGGASFFKIIATAGAQLANTRLVVATSSGIFTSADDGRHWIGPVLRGRVTDLVVDPFQKTVMYAAVGCPYKSPGCLDGEGVERNGVYRSDDGGATWRSASSGIPIDAAGRIVLAPSSVTRNVVFAAAQDVHHSPNGTTRLLGLFRSADGGKNWVRLSASGLHCDYCDYALTVALGQTSDDTVLVGSDSVFLSSDGGKSFVRKGDTTVHADVHDIRVARSGYFVATDGGVYVSADGSKTWRSLGRGMSLLQFYPGFAVAPGGALIVGGTQDNGVQQLSTDLIWRQTISGDGGAAAISRDGRTIFAENWWYGNADWDGPRRKDAGCPDWCPKTSGIELATDAWMIPPLVMDPRSDSTLFYATRVVYRTTNAGDLWTTSGVTLSDSAVSALAVSPLNSRIVWGGTTDGVVRISHDAGQSWSGIPEGLPSTVITGILADARDTLIAYVTVSGYGTGHVYKTADGGLTWRNITPPSSDLPFNAIASLGDGSIAVATDRNVQVYLPDDDGWSYLGRGLPATAVYGLVYDARTDQLFAATHGRGVYAIRLGTTLASTRTEFRQLLLQAKNKQLMTNKQPTTLRRVPR